MKVDVKLSKVEVKSSQEGSSKDVSNQTVIGVASVLLQLMLDDGRLDSRLLQLWREGIADEDKMRGIAVDEAMKRYPNMGVTGVITQIIRIDPKIR